MDFIIRKDIYGSWWHDFNNDATKINISDFEAVIDSVANTFIIQCKNGSNVPTMAISIANVKVINQIVSDTPISFSGAVGLKNLLTSLSYTPYLQGTITGQAVVYRVGQVGVFTMTPTQFTNNFDVTGLGTSTMIGWALRNGNNGTKNQQGKFSLNKGAAPYDVIGTLGGSANSVLIGHDHESAVFSNGRKGVNEVGTGGTFNGNILVEAEANQKIVKTSIKGQSNTGADVPSETGVGKNMPPYLIDVWVERVTDLIITTSSGGGGGGAVDSVNGQTGVVVIPLDYLPLAGGTMDDGADIFFDNGSKLSEGLYDEGTFGNKGIARTCAVGYEDKWEAGEQYITETGSGIIQFRRFAFNVPTVDDDTSKRYAIGSYWQMRNNDIYICTDNTEGAAEWELYSVGATPTLQEVTDNGNDETTNNISVKDSENKTTLRQNGINYQDIDDGGNTLLRFEQTPTVDQEVLIRGLSGTMALLSDIPTTPTLEEVLTAGSGSNIGLSIAGTNTNIYLEEGIISTGSFAEKAGLVQLFGEGYILLKAEGTDGTIIINSISENNYYITIPQKATDSVETLAFLSDIGTIPTTTSQLTNDGADGVNPFITALDIPVAGEASTLVREVKNMTGATLTKGTVVYISGANGNKALVSKAIATTDALSARTFGLLQSDILNNGLGNCVIIGDLSGINTSAFAEGAQLYLSGVTAGAFTDTRVLAPTHLVYVGKVTRSHPTQGQIEVQIQNGYELAEIHDVQIITPLNNQALVYETSSELWKNKTIIEDAIVNGVTTVAPSQNAVFDALETKFTLPALTSGSVLFSNGSTIAQDNANLFWDDTNNRLGIGNASPQARLDVRAQGALSTDIGFRVRNSANTTNLIDVNGLGDLSMSNSIKISTLNSFGLNYIIFNALTSNQGISSIFSPNGTPSGLAYNFQFSKSSSATNNSLLFIGGGNSSGNNVVNKHVISTSADSGALGQRLVLRVASTGQNFSAVRDQLSIFPNGNVVIQNDTNEATDIASSKLTVESTTQGFLPPRMTTTQKNAIASPVAGLVVYDSTLGKLCVRTASAWETITSI